MKIFWSWQSDRDPKLHHYFVRDVLKDVCKLIANDPEYEEAQRPNVDHDTKDVAGTPDITKTILDKIATANVFVADMTPVGMTDPVALRPNAPTDERAEPKYLQNPNVMSELGYAEHAISQTRIILVANSAHYPGPAALPFDWRHRSGARTYHLKDTATNEEIRAERKRFADLLKTCIKPILVQQAAATMPHPPIDWQPASDNDPTIWKAADPKLTFRNNRLGDPKRSVQLSSGARIYARIAPSEWTAPARTELGERIVHVGLAIKARDGDWGLNDEGALSVWGWAESDVDHLEVNNATQWFRSNGELWAVNSNCFTGYLGQKSFACAVPFEGLDIFLQKGIDAIKEMGGKGRVGIKLGAGDLTGTFWPGQYSLEYSEAVTGSANVEDELEIWTPIERRALLHRFWNAMRDAYGLPPTSTIEEFERVARVQR